MDITLEIIEQSVHLLNIKFKVLNKEGNLFIVSPEFAAYLDNSLTKQQFPFLNACIYEIQEGIILITQQNRFYCVLDFSMMLDYLKDMFLKVVKAMLLKAVSEPDKFHKFKDKPVIVNLTPNIVDSCKKDELLILSDSYASSYKKIYN